MHMRYVRPAITWIIVIAIAFLAYRFLAPLLKSKPPEMDVQTIVVQREDLRLVVPADGVVQPATLVEVKSKASDVVESIDVQPGDKVTAGQVLVELSKTQITSRLKQAQADLEASKARLQKIKANMTPREKAARESAVRQAQLTRDQAKDQYDRFKELRAKDYVTQKEVDDARTAYEQAEEALKQAQQQLDFDLKGGEPEDIAVAQAEVLRQQAVVDDMNDELANTTIRSPIAGTVLSRPVEVGTAVASGVSGNTGGTVVATVGDLSTLYIKAQIDETDLGRVQVGLPCRVSFDAYTGWIWNGKVSKIYPQGESSTNGGSSGTRFRVDVSIDLKSAHQESERGGGSGANDRGGGRRSGRMIRIGSAGLRNPFAPTRAYAAEPAPPPPPPGTKDKTAKDKAQDGAAEQAPAKEKAPELYALMTANVEIVLEDHPNVLVLPSQYIKYDSGKPYCEVLPDPKDQKQRERRELTVGFSDGLRNEIVSGLTEGETVILERPIKKEA